MKKRTFWFVVVVVLCCCLAVVGATQATKIMSKTTVHPGARTLATPPAGPAATASHVSPLIPATTPASAERPRTEYDYAKENFIRRQEGSVLSKAEELLVRRYFPTPEEGGHSLDAIGGPDGYNMYYVDNQTPDTAVYSWVEIKTTGTRVTALNGVDDSPTAPFTLGGAMQFPFYGTNYTGGNICSNGNIQFSTTNTAFTNAALPSSVHGAALFPLWDDLLVGTGTPGGVYVQNFADLYYVIEWDSVTNFSGTGSPKFEVILYANGKIKFQYNSIGTQTATIGIQGAGTGTNFLQYNFNGAGQPFGAGTAIWFYRFLPPTAELAVSNLSPCGAEVFPPNPTGTVSFRVSNGGLATSLPATAHFSFDGGATTGTAAIPAIPTSSFFDVFFGTTINLSAGNHTLSGWFTPHDTPATNDSAACAITVVTTRPCATMAPADANLDPVPSTPWAGSVNGNCGNGGKWDASFTGVTGYIYHFDLCADAPGAGQASEDVDIKICDPAGNILAGVDGLSSCSITAWDPNDFTWTCPAPGTYYAVVAPYPSYYQHSCAGTAATTLTMQYYALVPPPPPPNDNCANATVMVVDGPSFSGDNSGATQDCNLLGNPEVWFTFTTTECRDVKVAFCGSTTYQSTGTTWLFNSCPCGTNVASTVYDWNCVPANFEITFQSLPAGTYWYPMYAANTQWGPYTIAVTSLPCCAVATPPGAVEEGEICPAGYPDTFNGGCNSSPNLFSPIACGETIHGHSDCDPALYRDTDWYRYELTDHDSVAFTFTGIAEFPLQLLIIDSLSNPGCNVTVIPYAGTAAHCVPLTLTTAMLPRGVYWFWVGQSTFDLMACSNYVVSLQCTYVDIQCPQPTNVTAYLNTAGTNVWVHFNAPVPGRYVVYGSTVMHNDGDPRGGDVNFTALDTINSSGGVVSWTDPSALGVYKNYVVLTHSCDPVGRCCYNLGTQCTNTSQALCTSTYSGTWTAGLTCEANPCPLVQPPAGENCADAGILSGPLPIVATGTTVGKVQNYTTTGLGAVAPACWPVGTFYGEGSSGFAPDVTYQYTVPTTGTYTVSLCGSSYDTSLLIYNYTCPTEPVNPTDFICGDDDAPTSTCASNGLNSIIPNLSLTAGQHILIVVTGYSSTTGTYTMTISQP